MSEQNAQPLVAILGAGPAGLMAAECCPAAGRGSTCSTRMPSLGRKLLIAGRGGLNLTHSEPLRALPGPLRRGAGAPGAAASRPFRPPHLTAWAEGLGQPTFVGTPAGCSPRRMKASPLLRAWLGRLGGLGVTLQPRHRWLGWDAMARLPSRRRKAGSGYARPRRCWRWAAQLAAARLGRRLGARCWAGVGSRRCARPMSASTSPGRDISASRFAGAPLKHVALSLRRRGGARRGRGHRGGHRGRRGLCPLRRRCATRSRPAARRP